MKNVTLSRGPEIDTELCVRVVGGNKFDLILIAAQRARELRRQRSNETSSNIVDSLLDIQKKVIDPKEMLSKRASHKNRPTKKVDNTRAKNIN